MPNRAITNQGTRPRLAILAFAPVLLALAVRSGAPQDSGFVPIFDGKTLAGWRSAPPSQRSAWAAVDGAIQGTGLEDRLAYLVYAGDEGLRDFELRFSYRMLTEGNTGVELRARVDPTGKRPFEGYHADLGHVGIGPHILGAWDFHFAERTEFPCPRGTRLAIDASGAARSEKIENPVTLEDIGRRAWNQCRIVARGSHFQFFINGKLSSAFVDGIAAGGLEQGSIALQLHERGTRVAFREIRLKRLAP